MDTGGGTDNTTVVVEEVDTVVDTAVETLEVSATDASGTEDQAVALNIDASVSDATEQVQDIVISGVPAGAELSAGTDNGNGTWTLNQGDLVNLSITPAANSDQDFQLTVSVTAVETESGATATKTSALNVNVSGVADAPDLNVGQVTGLEDTSTPLNIGVNFVDTDGSETLEVTVIGVPTGATLSAGTDNGDGTWTLSEGDLAGLAITPPADFSGNFDLQVIAQTSEDGTVSNTVGEFNVNVVGTADAPVVTVTDAQGLEDNAIGLSIDVQLSDTDGSESITDITISGVPTGANLSAGTDNGDGTWTLTTADLTGLTVTPPLNSNDDIQLTVTAESSEIGDGSATAFSSFSVFITGVGDQPTVDVQPAAGNEDTVIPLDIQASLVDTDGSETIVSATITGVPDGATLSAGTDLGGGTWVLAPAELTGLNITPPADSNEDLDITVSATVQENDGATATTVTTLNVGLTDVADAPTVTVQGAAAQEDTAISLDITATLNDTDGSETITDITVSGVPTGASLSAGTDNGNGTWTLTTADLAGLTITPAADSNVDFSLTVSATSTEDDGDEITTVATLNVDVVGVADAPTVTVAPITGAEDSAIPLNIGVALVDTDGSETITNITVSGVPTGAQLSAGTDNGDGTWTLTPTQVIDLSVTPPANSNVDFSLTVSATSTEDDGDRATTVATFNVDVVGVADAPTVTVGPITGAEDSAIPLNIQVALVDVDGSESITDITISGVPTGANLSAGTDNGNGTWTLTTADLAGLTVTPVADSNVDFSLTVSATSTEDDGDSATTIATFNVDVVGVADAPTLTVAPITGAEDSAIPLGAPG